MDAVIWAFVFAGFVWLVRRTDPHRQPRTPAARRARWHTRPPS